MSKWNLVSLKEIVNNLDNKRVPLNSSQRELKESKPLYPYIGANNIMGYIDEYIFDEKILCVAEDGGSWGYNQRCAVLYNEKVWVNNHAHVITAKENLVLEYLMYYLNHTDLNLYINGATRGKLTKSSLESIQIPLPPIPQQQKIANILDAADAVRQNDKALIAKYDELTQALFLDMFGDVRKNEKGWKQIALEKICDVGSSRRVFVDELVEEGVPFYRGTEIGQMSINENINPSLFITSVHYENLKKETGIPKIGDLLMPSICPDGRIFEVTNDNPFYFKDGRVLWIKVNKSNINSVYLKKHLKAIFAVDYSKIASGTTFAELKIFALKKLILHYPPIDLQYQFAERVAVIEEQKAIAQKSLEKSEELFNSLLQKAFKGELV